MLSVTLGVMIGIVIHAGQVERADDSPPPFFGSSTSSEPPTSGDRPPAVTSIPAGGASLSPGSTAAPTQPRTAPTDLSSAPGTTPGASLTGPPAGTTAAGATATDTAAADTAATDTTSADTTATTATTDTVGGIANAEEPCPSLATRSEDAAGTTLYCQVDQTDHTLRWRAVVDGGGCLNQTMTGVGADGVSYACRLDGSGHNHWAPAS